MKTNHRSILSLVLLYAVLVLPAVAQRPGPRILTLSLSNGTIYSGTISLPGQQDRFTFVGAVGQRLYFDTLDYDGENINATLYAPSGATIFNINHSTDNGPFYLTEAGTNTLVLAGYLDTLGSYSFRMLDMSNALALTLGVTITNSLNPQSQTLVFSFPGTNGQRLTATNIAVSSADATWRLVSPAGQNLFTTGISSSPGEVALTETGAYLLLFEGNTAAIGSLDFRAKVSLISNPAGAVSGFGTVRSGNTSVDQTNDFTYTAPAGLPVYLDAQTNSSPVTIYFIDPSNTAIFQVGGGADSGPYVLPRSGTYTLRVVGYDAGSYKLQLLDLSTSGSGATALTKGVTYTATLNPAFKTDVYRFTGAVGQQWFYDALDADIGPVNVFLYDPLGNNVFLANNSDYDAGPFKLTAPGTYYLVQQSYSTEATNIYSFRLIDVAQSPATALAFDTQITGTLNPGTQADLYRFNGTNGQRFYFDAMPTNGSGSWYLYGPNNQGVSGNSLNGDFEATLPQNGTYVLSVSGNVTTPVGYSMRVVTSRTVVNALTLGATVAGTLLKPGDEHRFTFTGAAGQRLFYDALDADSDAISVYLYDPLGNNIAIANNSDYDQGPFTLATAGIYTLLIKGAGDYFNDYSFRLIDVALPPATVLAFDTQVSSTMNPGTKADLYRFSGTSGQRLYFDAGSTNGDGTWNLYGPNNQSLGGNSLNGDFEATLPQAGTYVLSVSGNGTNPVGYSIRMVAPNTVVSSLTLGATVAGTLVKSGDEHRFTFTGSAGQRLFYDALDADFDAINVYLYDPQGNNTYIANNSDYDQGLFTLAIPGTYTLLIKGSGDYVGDYSFRLLDLAAAPAISFGVIVTNQLNPQLQAQLYRINGTAGQRISVTNVAASNGNASWALVNPANSPLLSAGIQSDLGQVVLPTIGTHAVLVQGNSTDIGTLDYQFRVSLLGNPTGTTNGFGVVYCGTTSAGQTNTFTYTGPAGLPIYFDNYTNDATVTFQLLDPSSNAVFSFNGAGDSGPYSLPASGNYTLEAVGSASGVYCFRLLNLTASTTSNLTLGTAYGGPLDPGFRTEVYRFTGTNGQRLFYDALDLDFDSVSARLLTPSGGYAWINGNADSDLGPFTLSESGTYYVVVEGQQALPTDYRFRLIDANQSPAQSLAFDTVYSGDLFNLLPVPSGWLSVTGSYVNVNLRSYLPQDDWRVSQAASVTGTRVDTNIDFTTGTWGALADVGFTSGPNGSDGDWDNYSVQWDGTVTIANPNTRLYLRSDNSSRMWIDVNHNSVFENTATEFVNGQWGREFAGLSAPSVGLAPGTYRIRIQYEETTGANTISLLADTGAGLEPGNASLYRFNATAGQRLFFDSLNPGSGAANWSVYGPDNGRLGGFNLTSDFELTFAHTGSHLLVLSTGDANQIPFGFRVVTPTTTTNAYTLGTTLTGSIDEPGEEDWFSFTGTAGQRLYYDALDGENDPINATLFDPLGNVVSVNGNADSDVGPFTLNQTGTYLLRFKGSGDYTNNYVFRILDVAAAPVLALDTPVTNLITAPFGAALYQLPTLANLRLFFDDLGPSDGCGTHTVYGSQNQTLTGGYTFGSDVDIAPSQTGTGVVVLSSSCTNVPYMFQVIPGNHPPVLAAIGNQVMLEQTTLSFAASATDLEVPNDVLTWTLDAGAPTNATINASNGLFSWTPTEAQGPVTNIITIRVHDDGTPSFEDFKTFTVIVNESNQPPVLTLPANQIVTELVPLSLTATATDPDLPTNALTFALVSGPTNLTVSSAGAINWTPSEAQGPSTNFVTIKVTDSNPSAVNATAISVTNSFQIIVNESNSPPSLTLPANTNINELVPYTANATATDPDFPANPLTFALVSGPSNLTVSASGAIAWTPSDAQGPSTNIVSIKVSDSNPSAINATSLTVTQSYQIIVNEVNTAPALTVPADQIVTELVPLNLTATATDSDLPTNTLTFALVSGPTNLTVSAAGAITWTPSEAQGPSTNSVTIKVTDNNPYATLNPQLSVTNSFQIIVNESNSPPTLNVPPNTNIFTSAAYSATATATDPDIPVNPLTFALISPPTGMTINATNGTISWAPAESQGPSNYVVFVSVTDTNPPAINAKQLSVTNSYTINVIKLCGLAITAQPGGRAAIPGSTVSFTVTATTPAAQTNYQWQFNSSTLGGQTNDTLTITNLQSSGFGTYRVLVNDGICIVTSTPAILTRAVSPRFYNLYVNGTTMIVSFPTEIGPTYLIETKTNLNAPAWTLVTTYNGDGSPKIFTAPTQPVPRSFFRIQLQ